MQNYLVPNLRHSPNTFQPSPNSTLRNRLARYLRNSLKQWNWGFDPANNIHQFMSEPTSLRCTFMYTLNVPCLLIATVKDTWQYYVYWTVHHLDSWIKTDQLDDTCFIVSLFTAQHVSNVSTSIFRSFRLIVELFHVLYCSGSMCVGLGCGSAGVEWYLYAGWSCASVCIRIPLQPA